MKRQLRNHVAALCLLAPAALTFTALPGTALAQPATPQVLSLQVASDNGVNPGSVLRFTMEGTSPPRGSTCKFCSPGVMAEQIAEQKRTFWESP